MDKLNLAQLGERLKIGGAQMGRMVSGKVKEILQTPTPESKMIDEATLETLEEPNWGMNLRICAMINSEEFSGSEVVRAIKKKISGKNVVSQRLSLDLLETCAMNCEKVFSEVASEKVLDEMLRMIENPQTDAENRQRAMQLIRAWGESEELAYLPVFRQTYMSLRERSTNPLAQEGTSPTMQSTLESYVHEPLSPPERYPVPDTGLHGANHNDFAFNYQSLAVEEKKEVLVVARNSLELLSSILNTETDPKPLKEELTLNMLDKCKESQPVIKRIIETTTDDEGMLFEALFLHEELQQVISRYEDLEGSQKSGVQQLENPETTNHDGVKAVQNPGELPGNSNTTACEDLEDTQKPGGKLPENSIASEGSSSAPVGTNTETKIVDSPKEDPKSSSEKVGE
ncbi:PREDICTED: target of Myb protein 1 [Prunus mume]|uniref:Target of Myb protein 1 n=1 Tax=Prunus mume TaxID=102107 RepID=A0ABM0P830_PRUMU|nr:PREDICTED: target of Myb protein 1 [Prunus mume]